MNREIKFRALSDNNKWVYGTGIIQVEINAHVTEKYEMVKKVNYDELDYFAPIYDTEEIKIETLGQYTGLKDRNGDEIYEGDILREYSNVIEDWIVSYSDGKFLGTCNNICEDLYELSGFEVIGNVYESEVIDEKGI